MKLTYYGQSEKNKRKTNMDTLYIKNRVIETDEALIVLVCDGVGSLKDGALASSTATFMLKEWFESLDSTKQIGLKLLDYVQKINVAVRDSFNEEKINSATTLTACIVLEDITYVVHVGDTVMYTFGNNKIEKITKDDVSEKNRLSSYIGQDTPLQFQYYEVENKYDFIVICSDGITKTLSEDDIKYIVYSNKKPKNIVFNLIDKAMKNNESDNITCAVVKWEE